MTINDNISWEYCTMSIISTSGHQQTRKYFSMLFLCMHYQLNFSTMSLVLSTVSIISAIMS